MAGMNSVISQIATVLQGVSGIGTVYQYAPYLITPPKFPTAYIWTDAVDEEPHGMPQTGANGNKWVRHMTYCEVMTTTTKPSTDEALFRTLLDNIRLAYRDNPTLAATVLAFGLNITITIDPPERSGNAVVYRAIVKCEALEQIPVP